MIIKIVHNFYRILKVEPNQKQVNFVEEEQFLDIYELYSERHRIERESKSKK
jgi:hypothetical protein